MVRPTHNHPVSSWQWYVSAGATKEERRARLAECPDSIREEVRGRVEAFFKDRAKVTTG